MQWRTAQPVEDSLSPFEPESFESVEGEDEFAFEEEEDAFESDGETAEEHEELAFEDEAGPDLEEGATIQDEIASEAELGIGELPFAELETEAPEVDPFAARLGAQWSRRRNGSPSADALTSWLKQDYRDTIAGARRRWGAKVGTGQFTVEAITRAWMVSREENMKFQLASGLKPLGAFEPPVVQAVLTPSPLVEGSSKAPVAPLTIRFAGELRRRYPDYVRASNYGGHGGGKFNNRGYSLDLFIKGLDDRGFYPRQAAVSLLRAVHEAASAVGAQWRVIYNDFEVADAVNRSLGRQHVIFVGKIRKTGTTVSGLNWHGPAPLILHFHLDLAPLGTAGASAWTGSAAPADAASQPAPVVAVPSVSQLAADWAVVPPANRMRYVITRLVDAYQYPVNAAAGLVGNLWAESGVLPNRIEGSSAATPMIAADVNGRPRKWTAEEVRDREPGRTGPRRPGVGLAQWTSLNRRRGLFNHNYQGQILGANVMFNMDAQVDYLVHELRSSYPGVDGVLRGSAVSMNDACDAVLYNFEVPGSILFPKVPGIPRRRKRPRNDPAVVAKFEERRRHARTALQAYQSEPP